MVFGHVLPKKDGITLPVIKIAIHREIKYFALFIAYPLLGPLGSKDRMLYCKNELPPGLEP